MNECDGQKVHPNPLQGSFSPPSTLTNGFCGLFTRCIREINPKDWGNILSRRATDTVRNNNAEAFQHKYTPIKIYLIHLLLPLQFMLPVLLIFYARLNQILHLNTNRTLCCTAAKKEKQKSPESHISHLLNWRVKRMNMMKVIFFPRHSSTSPFSAFCFNLGKSKRNRRPHLIESTISSHRKCLKEVGDANLSVIVLFVCVNYSNDTKWVWFNQCLNAHYLLMNVFRGGE